MASSSSSHRVAVVGGGSLGIRIAGELALQGCTVHIYDHNPHRIQTVHSVVDQQLQELKQSSLLPHDQQLRGTIIADSLLSDAVTDAEFIIEAVPDQVHLKNSLFKDIASVCSKKAVLSSNTLNLALSDVYAGVPGLERTVGMRFLYPVYLIDSVEVTFHKDTSDETLSHVQQFLQSLGKSYFYRMPGEQPRLLSVEEAKAKQLAGRVSSAVQ